MDTSSSNAQASSTTEPANPPKKQSMLAWWGVLPVSLYLPLQFIFGWDQAYDQGQSASNATGILLGSVLGVIFISLFISWLAYRLSGWSQRTATVTFSIIVGLLSLSVVTNWMLRHQRNVHTVAHFVDTPVVASSGEFEFKMPKNWMPAQSPSNDHPQTVAVIGLVPIGSGKPEGVIQIDQGFPKDLDAEQAARSMAKPDGHITNISVPVDGSSGVRIDFPHTSMTQPRAMVVIFRQDQAYCIMAWGIKEKDVLDGLDHVLATWYWKTKASGR